MGKEAVFTREAEKAGEKTNKTTVVFGNSSGQIIVGDLACYATQGGEGMHVTTDEGCKTLTVSELDIKHPAVRIHERESIELAHVAGVTECAEVTPIDFKSLASQRLHSHEGSSG
jgi:hypothetical protein